MGRDGAAWTSDGTSLDDLAAESLRLVSVADTGCQLLTALEFDSLFCLWLAIDSWTGSVTALPYVLDPDLVAPSTVPSDVSTSHDSDVPILYN